MARETNQGKTLAAYREKQKRIAALLSRIQNKLVKHAESIINRGHVGDLGHVEELLSQIDGFFKLTTHRVTGGKTMTEHGFEQTAKDFIDYPRQAGKKERSLYTYSKDLKQAGAFFGQDKPITGIQPFHAGKFFKSDALLKSANGTDRAERTVAKTVRVLRMMMLRAKETGRIETLPLPKSTPMGRSVKKGAKRYDEHDTVQTRAAEQS